MPQFNYENSNRFDLKFEESRSISRLMVSQNNSMRMDKMFSKLGSDDFKPKPANSNSKLERWSNIIGQLSRK